MTLRRLTHRRLATAIQQAEIPRALEQAEEMLGGIVRIVDSQRAGLIDPRQQTFHALHHALRSGLEEDLRESRVLNAQGHHQPMQVHRFNAVDQLVKAARNVEQHGLHRHTFRQFKEQRRQLLFALGHHGGGEQRLLVGEMAVDRQLRHAGFGGDRVHAGAGITLGHKQRFRRVEDRLALG